MVLKYLGGEVCVNVVAGEAVGDQEEERYIGEDTQSYSQNLERLGLSLIWVLQRENWRKGGRGR